MQGPLEILKAKQALNHQKITPWNTAYLEEQHDIS